MFFTVHHKKLTELYVLRGLLLRPTKKRFAVCEHGMYRGIKVFKLRKIYSNQSKKQMYLAPMIV